MDNCYYFNSHKLIGQAPPLDMMTLLYLLSIMLASIIVILRDELG